MSYDKAIKYGKSRRKPYRLPKAVDPMCRNHGGCDWCEGNRMYQTKKEEQRLEASLKYYEQEDTE